MDLGVPELVIILVVVLVLFGPGKLPQIGEALGRTIRNFKKATQVDDAADLVPVRAELPAQTAAVPAPVAAPVPVEKV